MATFNGARFLPEQLASLARQTLLPFELVVADDGSTDDTLNVVAEFALTAPFQVKVLHNASRLGYGANFMGCASYCSGDIICFCDQDDIWAPNKIELCELALRRPDVYLAFHNATIFQEGAKFSRTLYKDEAPVHAEVPFGRGPWFIALGFTIAFKRELMQFNRLWKCSSGYADDSMHATHDQWISFIGNICGPIAYIPEKLALYRMHETNVSLRRSSSIAKILENIRQSGQRVYDSSKYLGRMARLVDSEITNLDCNLKQNFQLAARILQKLAEQSEDRLAIYRERSLICRIKRFTALVYYGCYRIHRANSLGISHLLKDLIIGTLLGGWESIRDNKSKGADPQLTRRVQS